MFSWVSRSFSEACYLHGILYSWGFHDTLPWLSFSLWLRLLEEKEQEEIRPLEDEPVGTRACLLAPRGHFGIMKLFESEWSLWARISSLHQPRERAVPRETVSFNTCFRSCPLWIRAVFIYFISILTDLKMSPFHIPQHLELWREPSGEVRWSQRDKHAHMLWKNMCTVLKPLDKCTRMLGYVLFFRTVIAGG